ncbi:hypothetical protein ROBYS_35420 [Roseobacter sp. OBYS 0001]|nr:hypothetical protein ROBYS_35420 [Roseobacter sp. OBYS 0001]
MGGGGDIIRVGQILCGQNRDNPLRLSHRVKVHTRYFAMGDPRHAECKMQRVGGAGDIINIAGIAGHMQARSIMGKRFGDAHGATSSTDVVMP